ncbi:MAG TPA: hypothetical protein VN229_02355, partial [Terriglobales bacterium]|nr:hypothetical protein [Terriglobales bacterium]
LARSIALPLYPKREPIGATARPPAHMLAALQQCGYRPDEDTAATPIVTGPAVKPRDEEQD